MDQDAQMQNQSLAKVKGDGDKMESLQQEDMAENEDAQLLKDKKSEAVKYKPRGCCMRLMCLLCCCDTSDIGAAAPLNRMNDKEIELYQKVLKKEMESR